MRIVLVGLLPFLACGCVSTATSIVKAPFQVAGKAVDWTTTSQSEADRNYGKKMRKQEEREGRERRDWAKKCRGHEGEAECREYTGFRAARSVRRIVLAADGGERSGGFREGRCDCCCAAVAVPANDG